jgi:hypothetical protein
MLFCASTHAMTLRHSHRILGEGPRPAEVSKTAVGVKVGVGPPKILLAASKRRPHKGRNDVHRSGLSYEGEVVKV